MIGIKNKLPKKIIYLTPQYIIGLRQVDEINLKNFFCLNTSDTKKENLKQQVRLFEEFDLKKDQKKQMKGQKNVENEG